MKNLKILVIVNLLLVLLINHNLSYYGKGYNIFKHKLLYGYNTDFDSLEGFKIEDEEFIQIIGNETEISDTVKVARVLKYAENDSNIFVEFMDSHNKIYIVGIRYDPKGALGNKIKYQIISNFTFSNELKWYNVYDSSYVQVLGILNLVFKISLIILIITLFYKIAVSKERCNN